MTRPAPDKPFNTSPEQALYALKTHSGTAIIDLDETLYLRNSTEDFIDCARPALLALLLTTLLELIKPWRWTGGEVTRDVWRVSAIRLFFPWTSWLWRRRVAQLASQFTNQPLHAALCDKPADTVVIATAGFRFIVTPLLAAMQMQHALLIATRSSGFADRRHGKLALVKARLGEARVHESLVLTDSMDDLSLLRECTIPLLTRWPGAYYRHALRNVYLPSQYLREVKRPGQRYIWRGILQEDFAFWVLSTWQLSQAPLQTLCGLSLLLFSFWCIYERGYVDNDLIATRYESDPQLGDASARAAVSTPPIQPWIWALVTGAAACLTLYPDDLIVTALHFLEWTSALVFTYLLFKLYNRATKLNRVWLFPLLQLARSCIFVVLVPISLIGAMALSAHTLSRWLPYILYRLSENKWPDLKLQLIRLAFFTVLLLLATFAQGLEIIKHPAVFALLLWNLFRARHELLDTIRNAARLDQQTDAP